MRHAPRGAPPQKSIIAKRVAQGMSQGVLPLRAHVAQKRGAIRGDTHQVHRHHGIDRGLGIQRDIKKTIKL